MHSPALRHRQNVLAAMAGSAALATAIAGVPAAPADGTPAGTEYAALRAALHEDLRALKDIASHEARRPMKSEMANKYLPWIAGVLEADAPVQDEILLTNMIWALDYADWPFALTLARFAIGHGLAMPEPFTRTPACFLAEQVAELALAPGGDVPRAVLLEVAQLVEGADMPDQVRAKLKKATGRAWLQAAEDFDPTADNAPAGGALSFASEALADLQRALGLDQKSGVKKDIQRTEALVKKLSTSTGEQQ